MVDKALYGDGRSVPHLMGSFRLAPVGDRSGMCFHRSLALVYDWPDAEVVVGIHRAATPQEQERIPNASKVPFVHVWVERNGEVYAPSAIERDGNRLRPMNLASYYAINGTTVIGRLTLAQIKKAAAGTGLVRHLRYGEKLAVKTAVGDIVMKAIGVDYGITAWGSVVPADSPEAVEVVRVK